MFTLKPEGAKDISVFFDKTFTVSDTSDSLLSVRGLSSVRYNYLTENFSIIKYGEGLSDYGSCDVYINGQQVADDVSEYDELWPAGTQYELRDIQAAPGYRYMGVDQGRIRGTVGSGETIVALSFEEGQPETEAVPFDDVSENAYYAQAVRWALAEGVTTGTTATTFSPDSTVTRAQAMTFLWRALGRPEPTSQTNPFTDIKPDDYFYKAVLWAVENGVTNGTSDTTFSPAQTCSQGHILTFLYRLNYEPDKTGRGQWYDDALRWAEREDLLISAPGAKSAPNEGCPRADVVNYLYLNLGDGGTPR